MAVEFINLALDTKFTPFKHDEYTMISHTSSKSKL